MTVAAGARKKKRAVRCETVGAVEPGTEAVLMIVAAVALRKEAVLDAVDRVGAREHVTVGRIEVVGEAVDVMVPAGFQKILIIKCDILLRRGRGGDKMLPCLSR